MSDTSPNQRLLARNPPRPAAGTPPPVEVLFEFVRASDHARFRIELRDDGAYGSGVQVFRNGGLLFTQRFGLRASAIEWAAEQRQFLDTRRDDARSR
jgi:hypothetical protein